MILADKIIELRKKNGWSQEELAEKLNVSRQSISKWEGAQSVPDMNRIIAMSQIFGVSTDVLLKDDLDLAPAFGSDLPVSADEPAPRVVTLEDAQVFLDYKNWASGRVALGVMLCIMSPIILIILGGLQEYGRIALTEAQAGGLGMIVLILMIGCAVALFVTTAMRHNRFEYIEEEMIETAYGVSGMARERRERYTAAHTRLLTIGIVLCVIAVIPIFLSQLFPTEDHVLEVLSIGFLLLFIAIGVMMIVRGSIIWGGFQALLEEGDYRRTEKKANKKIAPIASIYWLAVTAGFLAWSFITGAWDRTWIVWPIAGVAFGIVAGIARMLRDKA